MGPAAGHDRAAQAELSTLSPGGRLRKRSVTLAGHRTSLSVEQVFWDELKNLAAQEKRSLQSLIEQLDRERFHDGEAGISLSGAVRVYVLEALRRQVREQS